MIQLRDNETVYEYIKAHSKKYNTIVGAEFLAQGGEAIVYRIDHNGLDEIVMKTPLFK